MRHLLPALAMALATSATAQDLEGNDTASNWKVTHFEQFGIYLSSCDERREAGALKQRCYLRYVDVFSPRPEFAAQFFFVVNGEEGREVDFGLETGTLFGPNGFRIEGTDGDIWKTRRVGCLTGLSCTFDGEDADELLQAMQDGTGFRFTFRDRNGNPQDLTWPLAGFADAMADFAEQSEIRGL
ncbi:MAG: hypothetical protein JXQ85_13455 [Cognatishimia sp.]|uniref:hypothetical protein n=1 Tax=Cognatishimia sp. TaxID=2211648 RepID=UPI003B8E0929